MTDVVRIDYWEIVVRSLRLIWKRRFLWFFGFFASVSGGQAISWTDEGGPRIREFFLAHVEILVLVIVAVVVVWLALFIMNLISKGALIRSVGRAEREESISFETAWGDGLSTFWRLLGILVIGVALFLAGSIVVAVPIVLPLAAGAPGIAIAVLIGAILLLPYLAFLFALTFTVIYAEREVGVGDAGVTEALRIGWHLTRRFFVKSLGVWLVMFLSGMVFVLGLVITLLAVAIPFFLIGMANVAVALALGIPVGIVIVAVASGAYGAYAYSVWTLAYLGLRKGLVLEGP